MCAPTLVFLHTNLHNSCIVYKRQIYFKKNKEILKVYNFFQKRQNSTELLKRMHCPISATLSYPGSSRQGIKVLECPEDGVHVGVGGDVVSKVWTDAVLLWQIALKLVSALEPCGLKSVAGNVGKSEVSTTIESKVQDVLSIGKSLEHPRLGWVGIENKWSQLNPNFLPSRAPTNNLYRFSWHIKLFIPKITKIKYILNASLSVRIQLLCLKVN